MNLLSTILDTLIEHPYASAFLIMVGIRIVVRDLHRTKNFIAQHTQQTAGEWGGAERRGPNRAKNVIRPTFGATQPTILEPVVVAEPIVMPVRKTGTDN